MVAEANVDEIVGEARWPMAAAVIVVIALTLLVPDGVQLGLPWLLPAIEGVLLVVLILGDPGEITVRSSRLRALSIALVSVLVFTTTAWTVLLIDGLVEGDPWTNSARELLLGASAVWVANTSPSPFSTGTSTQAVPQFERTDSLPIRTSRFPNR